MFCESGGFFTTFEKMEVSASTIQLETSWYEVLKEEFIKPYFAGLRSFLYDEKSKGKILYPPGKYIFRAFELTPFDKVRVVILGQDPYPNPGQAHGLAFSVPKGVPVPPSLQNIYKELSNDVGFVPPEHGDLTPWAEQGVFLLNTILTVQAGKPASHRNKGWEPFTDAAISHLSHRREGLVFLLWGKFAQEKAALIDKRKHLVLMAAHPSPYSADKGFFRCRHFSKANIYLAQNGYTPINWQL